MGRRGIERVGRGETQHRRAALGAPLASMAFCIDLRAGDDGLPPDGLHRSCGGLAPLRRVVIAVKVSRCIFSPSERTYARYAGCCASPECEPEADRAAWAAGGTEGSVTHVSPLGRVNGHHYDHKHVNHAGQAPA